LLRWWKVLLYPLNENHDFREHEIASRLYRLRDFVAPDSPSSRQSRSTKTTRFRDHEVPRLLRCSSSFVVSSVLLPVHKIDGLHRSSFTAVSLLASASIEINAAADDESIVDKEQELRGSNFSSEKSHSFGSDRKAFGGHRKPHGKITITHLNR